MMIRYYKFHLDARTKLLASIIITLYLFTFTRYRQYAFMGIIFGLVIVLFFTRQEQQELLKHWKLFLFIPTVNLIANMLFSNGRDLYSWGIFHLTKTDILIFLRIFLLLICALSVLIKTRPQAIAVALGKLAYSVSFHRYRGSTLPLVIMIMLSFVNQFQDVFITVRRAYRLRHTNKQNSHLLKRLIVPAQLLLPIMIIALKNANQLATTLVAKGFHRTATIWHYDRIHYHFSDGLFYAGLLVVMIIDTVVLG